MASLEKLTNGIALGAPVVIVEHSLLVHLPTPYRLGRGSRHRPISWHVARGEIPVTWTTVCGLRGTVVLNRGLVVGETPACPDCHDVVLGALGGIMIGV